MKKILTYIKKLLELLKPGKSYVSCEWLEYGMIFDTGNLLRVCCFQSNKGGGRPMLWNDFTGNIDLELLFERKNLMRDLHRKGQIMPECEGCPNLIKKKWSRINQIKKLLLTHWIDCNSDCVYCPAVRDDKLKERISHYNIVPVIKNLFENKVITQNTLIDISGGEALIYPEFKDLMELLFANRFKNIVINSSGIKLSKSILKGLEKGCVNLTISLDAGEKETHEKIKQVKSFDIVISNLKKYLQSARNKDSVITKYIIAPPYNDNQEEIEKWFILNKELGIKNVFLDIEISCYRDNSENIPDKIKNLVIYSKKNAKKFGLKLVLIDRALMVYNDMKKLGVKDV